MTYCDCYYKTHYVVEKCSTECGREDKISLEVLLKLFCKHMEQTFDDDLSSDEQIKGFIENLDIEEIVQYGPT